MARALYQGQLAGDEQRGAADSMGERLLDNEIVEGQEVAEIKRLFKCGDWPALNRYTDRLLHTGWSIDRVQSMLTRATTGVRMPKR